MPRRYAIAMLLGLHGLVVTPTAMALDYVSLRRDGKPIHIAGKILVEAEDGGLLAYDREGTLWAVQPEELTERRRDEKPFEFFSKEETAKRLLDELPRGFRIHKTLHFVICYNTSQAYAYWCGALYERLYRGFYTYWKNKGLELEPPQAPLVALVFDRRASFTEYAKAEMGDAAGSVFGYYSLRTNRVCMFDLTGTERGASGVRGGLTAKRINQILARPEGERTVATIVHEATHQLAFNSGLQKRYVDTPMWLSEGIAIFFESPDLKSSKGWRTIGAVNRVQLASFRAHLRSRSADSLDSLVRDNQRFQSGRTAASAYAESWALTYFLIRTRPKQFLEYLKRLAESEDLTYEPEERIQHFKSVFGEDMKTLDTEFLRSMRRVR